MAESQQNSRPSWPELVVTEIAKAITGADARVRYDVGFLLLCGLGLYLLPGLHRLWILPIYYVYQEAKLRIDRREARAAREQIPLLVDERRRLETAESVESVSASVEG